MAIVEKLPTTIDEAFMDKYVALSNALIQSRERTSLLESKIELLSIYKLKTTPNLIEKLDAKGKKYSVNSVSLNLRELKQITGSKSNNLYKQIEGVAFSLSRKLYIYRDPDSKEFVMNPLYGEVSYKNGKLQIDFNPQTERLFIELGKDYTKINLSIAMSFKTNGGFQLYKILETEAFKLPDIDFNLCQEDQARVRKVIPYQELRLELGYVDTTQSEIQNEALKMHPDYKKIEKLDKKPKYQLFQDFLKKVLNVGVEEINEISDIYITLQIIRGAHGKIEEIEFFIRRNLEYYKRKNGIIEDECEEKKELSEDEIIEFIITIKEMLSDELSIKQLKEISELANYDIETIEKSHNYTMKAKYKDYYSYLYDTIKNKYYEKKDDKGKEDNKNKDNIENIEDIPTDILITLKNEYGEDVVVNAINFILKSNKEATLNRLKEYLKINKELSSINSTEEKKEDDYLEIKEFTEDIYKELCGKYGNENVDNTIKRMKSYKEMEHTLETLKKWLDEKAERQAINKPKENKSSFNEMKSRSDKRSKWGKIYPSSYDGIPFEVLANTEKLKENGIDLRKVEEGEMTYVEYGDKWFPGMYDREEAEKKDNERRMNERIYQPLL